MNISIFVGTLLFVAAPSFAATMDISTQTSDLRNALRKAIPFRSRYFHPADNELRVQHDHELVLAPVDTLDVCELIKLRDFLKGQPLEDGFRIKILGRLSVRDTTGRPIDLDDPQWAQRDLLTGLHLLNGASRWKDRLLKELHGKFPAAGSAVILSSPSNTGKTKHPLWDRPNAAQYDIFLESSEPEYPKAAFENIGARGGTDFTPPVFETSTKTDRHIFMIDCDAADAACTASERSIWNHVMGHIDSQNRTRWSVHEIRDDERLTPEDLALDTYRAITLAATELPPQVEELIMEVSDVRLSPNERTSFRRELSLLATDGFPVHEGRSPLAVVVRYQVNTNHRCVQDLLR